MALIDRPVPVSRGRSCPFRGRVWPNAPASAPTEAGPPVRGKRETMSENLLSDQVENASCLFACVFKCFFFCGTWSRLRVTRSFRSSALLLSSSSSISSVFILSWQMNRFRYYFFLLKLICLNSKLLDTPFLDPLKLHLLTP